MAYEVNYDDERFQDVKDSEKTALKQHDDMVSGMVSQIDDKYNALVNASKDYQKEQERLQNEKTDFAIKQIEQQKAWAEKDYKKEQSGAYTDWQKQSNQYGVNAEKTAAQGLAGTGYSESSQVSMYNTYQNRVAAARESFQRTKENYDNSIMQAQLQNSSVLAQIAADAQKEQLTLLLEGFQYKNTLVLEQAAQRRAIEQNYYTRYQDVLNQINWENQHKTAAEQWEKNYLLQLDQFNLQKQQYEDAKIAKERERTAKAGATTAAAAGAAIAAGKVKQKKDSNTVRGSSDKKAFTGSTYKEANEYLKRHGAEEYNLMPESEWWRKKQSHMATGIGGYEVSANDDYSKYLATATKYAVETYGKG